MKRLIEQQKKNYWLWNQQVEGVILAQRVHKFILIPRIQLKFKNAQDQVDGKVSDEYEEWIVQDQVIFIWFLYTISESVLPRVLSCKHAFEVCNRTHKYFNANMKAHVLQLRVELKSIKKG